jgi:hypothetical protein
MFMPGDVAGSRTRRVDKSKNTAAGERFRVAHAAPSVAEAVYETRRSLSRAAASARARYL